MRIYIVEGAMEEKLLKACIRNKSIEGGKSYVLNIWENNISRIIPKINANTEFVIVVADNDVNYTQKAKDRYNENLKILEQNYKKVQIILHDKNFEDEIVKASSNIKKLNEIYDTKTKQDFKNKFNKDRNLLFTLNNIGFDITKMWEILPNK